MASSKEKLVSQKLASEAKLEKAKAVCAGKTDFKTRSAAQSYADTHNKYNSMGKQLSTYQCDVCDQFHLTSSK